MQRALGASMKLPKRAAGVVSAFYMAAIMAFLMCVVISLINGGSGDGLWRRVLHSYALAGPVAFVSVLVVRPLVAVLVRLTVRR
jgi:hypothetical protein